MTKNRIDIDWPAFENHMTALASFAVAAAELKEKTALRDCAAFLGDDGRTVTLYAHYSSDDAVSSQFKLPSAVAAEDFDSNYYRRLLEKDHA
jgi:hypothetical protein